MRNYTAVIFRNCVSALVILCMALFASGQAPLYSGVLISDVGTDNGIGQANTSRNLGVDAAGNIYAVFSGSLGIRVAKSTNRGQSFSPSVLVSAAYAEPEIEVASNGNVYIAWNVGLNIYFSVSVDGGLTFSPSALVATAPPGNSSTISGYVPHMASYENNVYILPQSNKILYRNSTNGVGGFTATSVGTSLPGWFFSDVRVDRNGEVYVVIDYPTLHLFRSIDNGGSFTEVNLSPRPSVSYSSYAMIAGSFGSYIFTGGSGANGNRIDVNTGATNSLGLMTVVGNSYGRSLFADEFGNVVDGYTNVVTDNQGNIINGKIGFRVSHNQGQAWNPAVSMFAAQTHNIFRNPVYQDVLVSYKQNDQVYLAVYKDLLLGLTNTTPPLSDCAGKAITVTYTSLGPYLAGNVFTAQLSDAAGSFAAAVNIGTVTSTTSGIIAAVIPPNTPGGTGYRIRVKSSTPELFGTDNGSNLTVNPNPGSNFTFAAQQCQGTAVAFTNTSTTAPANLTRQWTFGDGGTSTDVSPSHLFAPGTYDVKLVSTTALGCKDSITKQVIVGAKPQPQFTTNAASQCIATNNFMFTNTTPNPGSFTYEWKFGDGATATGLNATHTYAAVGPYVVTLIATAANGCRDSVKHDVTVNTSTNPSFTVNISNQCLNNNSFVFTNTTPPGSTYEWHFRDGTTSTDVSPTHMYTAAGSYSVRLYASAAGGCKDSTFRQVYVYTNPVASFTINDDVQCQQGNNFFFTSTSTGASGSVFDFGDGQSAVATATGHVYAAPGDYVVKLRLSNNNVCTDSALHTITVISQPTPGFTVNAATQCLVNNAFRFTNTSTSQNGAMTYDWRFGDGGTSTLRDPVHSYAATGSYTVRLYVRVSGECIDSAQITVNINPTPKAAFTANSVNAQCLNGNSYSFTNTSTIASGTLNYLWRFGDGVTATAQHATHVYTTAGTYTVKLYATAATGCVDSAEHTVTVHPKPVVSFINDNPEQCLPTNHFTFTNTTTIGSGTMTYGWTFGDGGQSTIRNAEHTYLTFGAYTIKLVVTSDKGCKDSTSQNINFLPKPVPVFMINDAGQCLTGNAFTFTDASTITAGTFTREWRYGDGATATTVNGSHSYAAANNYEVALILVSDRGCTDTLRKPVNVHPMPAVSFTVNNAAQCVNVDAFTFTNGSTISSGTMTYAWTFDDGGTSIIQNPTYSYAVANNYTVGLVATSNEGCTGTDTKPVQVFAQPQRAAFAINQPEQCLTANNFVFTNTSPTAGGPLTYKWMYGDGTEATTTDGAKRYTAVGDYTVKLVSISPNGCVSDTMPQVVKVHPEPSVNLGADRIVLEGLGIKLNPALTGTGLTYLWTPDRYLSSNTGENPTVTPADNVTYTLTVTGPGGCTDSDDITLAILKKLVVPNAFSPNGDGVNDKWVIPHLDIYPGCTVEVYSRSGQLIYRSTGYLTPWDGRVNGSLLPVGTYYYVIDPKNGRAKFTGSLTLIR